MKRLNYFVSILVLLLLAGCGDGVPEGNVIITGKFPSFAGNSLVLNKMAVYEAHPVDTIQIDEDGLFKAGVTIEQPEFFLLKFDNRNYLTLLVEPGENIEVASRGMIKNVNYTVAGSPGSEKIYEIEAFIDAQRQRLDSIRDIYQGADTRGQFTNPAVMKEFGRSKEMIRQQITEMINHDPSSLSALLFLNKRFGQEKLFREREDFSLFLHVDSILSAKYPGNIHVSDLHQKVEKAHQMLEAEKRAAERLAPGRPAPDFTMEGFRGMEVSLSDLKGKVVLLYFWASTDEQCRKTNKQLKKIYSGHKNKGFEVMAVSLDTYEDMWRNAIQVGNLNWINVTDLQNIYSAPVFLYQVPADLPYFYLIDKEQQIAWKGTQLGEMEKNLGSLLSN